MKNILLIGATGSIGDCVLNVIWQNDSKLNLFGIAVGKNIKKTDDIIKKFLPKYVFVDDVAAYDDISSSNPDKNILNSDQELLNLISDDKVDIVISAIVGFAGLKASLMAVNAGKTVLIANKESIVAAGDILMPLARSKGSTIIPIDSEHNAIFQCLPEDKTTQDVDKIIYEFKKAMLPSYTSGFLGGSGNDRTLSIPTTIDIEYFFDSGQGGKRNNYLNKITTCYLTDMDVSFGGDRYVAYSPSVTQRDAGNGEGAPPQRTSVTLNFSEIEIVTQEDIDLGF